MEDVAGDLALAVRVVIPEGFGPTLHGSDGESDELVLFREAAVHSEFDASSQLFEARRPGVLFITSHSLPAQRLTALDRPRIFRGAEELLRLACGTSPKIKVADSFGLSSASAQIRNVCVQPRRRGGVGKNARSRA
ncbi:hypothetical protein HPB50_007369 [Hyalomma asiaticum]|uniref:Uncharacterized protein n=1 Tax=Hyalomma asiaticum TaxID=266040 RepID=A0ACB7TCE3_HYAAI|nr:hypothetical protein HPB50_007369 [Hyalomma asiaticum]